MNRRGVSSVIATILIIAIVLVAIIMVWVVVSGLISDQLPDGGIPNVRLEIVDSTVAWYETSDYLEMNVERSPGQGELVKAIFFVEDNDNKQVSVEQDASDLDELETKFFRFEVEGLTDNLKKVSVAPVVMVGDEEKILSVTDEFLFSNLNEPPTSCIGDSRAPSYCSGCTKYECGSNGLWQNRGCRTSCSECDSCGGGGGNDDPGDDPGDPPVVEGNIILLDDGWNLVSPLDNAANLAEVDTFDTVISAQYHDYDMTLLDLGSNPLEVGKAYWLLTSGGGNITFANIADIPEMEVNIGWNLLGVPQEIRLGDLVFNTHSCQIAVYWKLNDRAPASWTMLNDNSVLSKAQGFVAKCLETVPETPDCVEEEDVPAGGCLYNGELIETGYWCEGNNSAATSTDCPDVCFCSDCVDCNLQLADAGCEIVQLTSDMSTTYGYCFIASRDNTIIDCKDHVIEGSSYQTDAGISVGEVSGLVIKNCVFESELNIGIRVGYGLADSQILDNTFNSNPGWGMDTRGSPWFSKIDIQNNEFQSSSVYIEKSESLNLSGNSFTGKGVTIGRANGGSSNRGEIINNVFQEISGTAINLALASYILITNNQIINSGKGIFLDSGLDNEITFNEITGATGSAIEISAGGYIRNSIFDNTITNSNVGIFIKEGLENDVRRNSVTDSTETGLKMGYGPYSVTGNEIYDNVFCGGGPGIKQDNGMINIGDDNTCDTPDNWDDDGTTDCTNTCP